VSNEVLGLEPLPEAVSESAIDKIRVYSYPNVSKLEAEIELAKHILDLEDDWDGEGSPRYSVDTLERAARFIRTQCDWLWDLFGMVATVPRIGPGPNGGIDIHWKQPSWELLVNIPAENKQMATFYGDDYGVEVIRGSFDPAEPNRGLIAWLMK